MKDSSASPQNDTNIQNQKATRYGWLLLYYDLPELVEVLREADKDLFALIYNDAREADSACFLDRNKFLACVAVLQKLLEREHTRCDVDSSILNACLGKSLFHRSAGASMLACVHSNVLHSLFSFFLSQFFI